jgi:hypothetical protein
MTKAMEKQVVRTAWVMREAKKGAFIIPPFLRGVKSAGPFFYQPTQFPDFFNTTGAVVCI